MRSPEIKLTLLDLIAALWRERGYGPTMRELTVGAGLSPTGQSTVHRAIELLERRGYISRRSGASRDLMVVGASANKPPRPDLSEVQASLRKFGATANVLPIEIDLLREWLAYTTTMERLAMTENHEATSAPLRNRWPGKCHQCGGALARAEGVAIQVGGKWKTFHHHHSGLTAEQIEALPEALPQARTEEEKAQR